MNTHDARVADSTQVMPGPGAMHLSRGISTAWWYTLSTIVFFELIFVLVLWGTLVSAQVSVPVVLTALIGGALWFASTFPLLFDYRHREDATPGVRWRRLALPLLVALTFGVTLGLLSGSWLLGSFAIAQSLSLLNWQRGVRIRVVGALTAVLIVLWIIDTRFVFAVHGAHGDPQQWWLVAFYATFLPVMTVLSLWWWDVLNALDRARASEARLAATQERLRLATDVHDLQGHHLQVIALQLELAERLMGRDADAALEQLRAARASVGDAQQGTRDLATSFRSVPLTDELANASDLLRAAGLSVEVTIAADAAQAPASDLGPVIRETTTNILRHGGGKHARLSLTRSDATWRYEIVNDVVLGAVADREGSGLEGIRRRVREAEGTLEVRRGDEDFAVIVTVPDRPVASTPAAIASESAR